MLGAVGVGAVEDCGLEERIGGILIGGRSGACGGDEGGGGGGAAGDG